MKLKFHIPVYKNTKEMLKGKYNQQKSRPWATTREIMFLQVITKKRKKERWRGTVNSETLRQTLKKKNRQN